MERMDISDDSELLYVGFLTIGDQKKEGTQISFKDKYRRYFVLRCLSKKLLTLSGYKNEKEFKSPHGNLRKHVEQIVLTPDTKIHSVHFPAKKNKYSNVLCILKDKHMKYLEADTREDLDAWCAAFNEIFIRLGWKERSPPPIPRPLSPTSVMSMEAQHDSSYQDSFPQHSMKHNGQSQDQASAELTVPFESHQPDASTARPLSQQGPMSEESESHYERPKSSSSMSGELAACCTRSHMSLPGIEDPDRYVNIHNIKDHPSWLEETHLHHERLISIRDIYANLPVPHELHHPAPPPTLPPRSIRHRRGGTFPGAHTPPSSPQLPQRHSGSYFEHHSQPSNANIEIAPKISITEPHVSPLPRQFPPHLFDDVEEVNRKISLPQPLNIRKRKTGLVLPPITTSVTPPDSPVTLRKAGSYSNLSLNLSNRPLPSPVQGDSFDVHTLRWEIGHTNGFPIALDKSDLQDALGLVRIADYVWVAGWKSGKSEITKKLHVGDQLRQINEQIIVDPVIANTLFTTSAVNEILLIIRRLPHAKVRHLHRSSVNESWGLEVEGNRVIQVSKSGPASQANVTPRAQGAFSERLCDWIITEIDGVPVSLLSKRDEVKNLMANAGTQMTLVIQPDDFIKKLNAELQKVKFAHEYFVGSDNQDST